MTKRTDGARLQCNQPARYGDKAEPEDGFGFDRGKVGICGIFSSHPPEI